MKVQGSEVGSGFDLAERLRSFRYAFNGIGILVRTQHNAWIHVIATMCVIALGWAAGVTVGEWCSLVLAMALVWVAESFNTALELLCDRVSPEYCSLVKQAKDVAAGAVLLAAMGSVVIAILVFRPYLIKILL